GLGGRLSAGLRGRGVARRGVAAGLLGLLATLPQGGHDAAGNAEKKDGLELGHVAIAPGGREGCIVAWVYVDSLRSILRAASIAAFTVGLLLLLLNPPSLSGAGGLLTLIAGVILFVLVVAWMTVAAMGKEGPSEEEFERLIRRSEGLAASPQLAAEAGEVDLLVADAIDRLPPEFMELLR